MSQTPTNTPIIAASYERVSTRMQGQYGYSLSAQHRSNEEFARDHGWQLPEQLRFRDGEDQDASGKDWELPGLTAMLDAARRHEVTVLIVPNSSRFARDAIKAKVLKAQLKKYGIRVIYQRLPTEDTPEGRLQENMMESFDEYERELIALRTSIGRREKAKHGKVVGCGAAPYGYRFTYETLANGKERVCSLEPDPLTAAIAVRILRDVPARSTNAIAAQLNAAGVPSPSGTRWANKVIQRMATNPVYVGTWVYGRHDARITPERHPGVAVAVPALIERWQWEANQRALDERRTRRRARVTPDADAFVLRGMLTCGCCGGALQVCDNRGTRYYRCGRHTPSIAGRQGKPVCALPDVYASDLEDELWRVICDTFLDETRFTEALALARDQHDSADHLRRDRLASCDAAIAQETRRLDSIVAALIDQPNDELRASFHRQATDIAERVQKLKAERETIAADIDAGLSVEQAAAIQGFARELRTNLTGASSVERRWLFEKLELRGALRRDDGGKRLGRKYAYRMTDLEVRMPLLRQSSLFRNRVALRSTSPLVSLFSLVAA